MKLHGVTSHKTGSVLVTFTTAMSGTC